MTAPSSIPPTVPIVVAPRRDQRKLTWYFNESILGFLGLVAMATALGPLVFEVSPRWSFWLAVSEWVLVAVFAADFAIRGATAPNRAVWMRSPWRIVDVLVVVGPVLALLPHVSDLASGSITLRVLRLFRAAAFGTRAGSNAVRRQIRADRAARAAVARITVISPEGDENPIGADWDSFLAWTRDPAPTWYHASNVDSDRFVELARAAGLSDLDLERIGEDGHAKLREGTRYTTLFVQIPSFSAEGFPAVERDRLLAIASDQGVLTAITGEFELRIAVAEQREQLPKASFPVMIACAVLSLARDRNVMLAQRLVDESQRLETVEGGPEFLRATFRLRREISTAVLDLWHLRLIVRALADGKTTFRGIDLKDEKYLDDLLAEVESLYETLNRTKEDLRYLIELHINVKSFEMNTFLRLLAVVSFLGLIPSVVSGLLGMQVMGYPWPVTLGQISFGVAMGMAMTLYVFAAKGWLK